MCVFTCNVYNCVLFDIDTMTLIVFLRIMHNLLTFLFQVYSLETYG